jgi:hypothetical protein
MTKRIVPTQAEEQGDFPFGASAAPDTQPAAEPAADVSGPTPSANGTHASPDPFDLGALRLSPTAATALGVKKALLCVPVCKPNKAWFVRAHRSEDFRIVTGVIVDDRDTYLVAPALRAELATEATFRPKLLVTSINRQGAVFLWELNLPQPDGRIDAWSRTAMEAMAMATREWVRVTSNQVAGYYDAFVASAQLSEPEWPEVEFQELLRIAFRDKYIDRMDHPVLRKLRGEV